MINGKKRVVIPAIAGISLICKKFVILNEVKDSSSTIES